MVRTVAVSMVKMANDLRWMSSGPATGLAEIHLPDLQPGSSIMPGKVNPVIPEVVVQVAAQVIGNDAAVAFAGTTGSFELNVAVPVMARNLLESVRLLAAAARVLADRCVAGLVGRRRPLPALRRVLARPGHRPRPPPGLRGVGRGRAPGPGRGPDPARGRRRAGPDARGRRRPRPRRRRHDQRRHRPLRPGAQQRRGSTSGSMAAARRATGAAHSPRRVWRYLSIWCFPTIVRPTLRTGYGWP